MSTSTLTRSPSTAAPGAPLASLALAMLLSSLGSSIANVALPAFAHAFHASFQAAQWIVLAYLLAITALIVSMGRLGDLLGRRRLLLGGIGLFTVASAACAVAPTLPVLVAARALQGAGAAVMMALTVAFVAGTVPKDRTGRAMGLLASMSSVGTALGPTLGGLLLASAGWRGIFAVIVPLGALAWVLAYRHLPRDRHDAPAAAGFDWLGTALLASTLLAYAGAVTAGDGRIGPVNLGLMGAAVAGVGVFLWTQRRASSPLIDLAVFRRPAMRAGFAMSVLVMTVLMSMLIVGPFHLSGALALAPAQVGLAMSVGPVVAAVTGVPAGRAVDRFGTLPTTLAGLLAVLAGCMVLAVLPARTGLVGVIGYLAPLAVVAAGYALFQAANHTAVMQGAPTEQRGAVSGVLGLSRSLGSITGASVMGAVFAAATAGAGAGPAAVAAGMRATFAVAGALIVVASGIALVGQARSQRGAIPH